MTRRLRAVAVAAVLLVSIPVAGCTADDAAQRPTPSASSPDEQNGGAPTLEPDGSAKDNLPLFAAVTEKVWKGGHKAEGRAYIDALEKAGFDRDHMQVTADRTTVDRDVESLQFSVAWGKNSCLIGQVGPSTGDPVTAVAAQLDGGVCLIGQTREIDW